MSLCPLSLSLSLSLSLPLSLSPCLPLREDDSAMQTGSDVKYMRMLQSLIQDKPQAQKKNTNIPQLSGGDGGCFVLWLLRRSLDECGWVWMSVDECGWVWMSLDEFGWVWRLQRIHSDGCGSLLGSLIWLRCYSSSDERTSALSLSVSVAVSLPEVVSAT